MDISAKKGNPTLGGGELNCTKGRHELPYTIRKAVGTLGAVPLWSVTSNYPSWFNNGKARFGPFLVDQHTTFLKKPFSISWIELFSPSGSLSERVYNPILSTTATTTTPPTFDILPVYDKRFQIWRYQRELLRRLNV